MSDRLYRHDHADADIFMLGSLWKSSPRTLGDYIKQLYGNTATSNRDCSGAHNDTNRDGSNDKSSQPAQSKLAYIQEPNGSITVNITDDTSSITYTRDEHSSSNAIYHKCKHDNNRSCNCTDKCVIKHLEQQSSAQGEDKCSWPWPCVIPGATIQKGYKSAKLTSDGGYQSVNSKGNADAQPDNDGSINN